MQTAFGYSNSSSEKQLVNTTFVLSSGCCKNNYLVIPLQPRKVVILAILEVFKHQVYVVTLHGHDEVIGLVLVWFCFSFLELVLALLYRVGNGVETGTCVACICVLRAVSSGHNIAALPAAPHFSLEGHNSLFQCLEGMSLSGVHVHSRRASGSSISVQGDSLSVGYFRVQG